MDASGFTDMSDLLNNLGGLSLTSDAYVRKQAGFQRTNEAQGGADGALGSSGGSIHTAGVGVLAPNVNLLASSNTANKLASAVNTNLVGGMGGDSSTGITLDNRVGNMMFNSAAASLNQPHHLSFVPAQQHQAHQRADPLFSPGPSNLYAPQSFLTNSTTGAVEGGDGSTLPSLLQQGAPSLLQYPGALTHGLYGELSNEAALGGIYEGLYGDMGASGLQNQMLLNMQVQQQQSGSIAGGAQPGIAGAGQMYLGDGSSGSEEQLLNSLNSSQLNLLNNNLQLASNAIAAAATSAQQPQQRQHSTLQTLLLKSKEVADKVVGDLSGDMDPTQSAIEVLKTSLAMLGYSVDQADPSKGEERVVDRDVPIQGLGGPHFSAPTMLAHPDEFKNPSSFLKIYGDPLCGGAGNNPVKGQNGNWTCSKCQNVNFPRRFRCNKCNEYRDAEGDEIVSEYSKTVYHQHLRTYKQLAAKTGMEIPLKRFSVNNNTPTTTTTASCYGGGPTASTTASMADLTQHHQQLQTSLPYGIPDGNTGKSGAGMMIGGMGGAGGGLFMGSANMSAGMPSAGVTGGPLMRHDVMPHTPPPPGMAPLQPKTVIDGMVVAGPRAGKDIGGIGGGAIPRQN